MSQEPHMHEALNHAKLAMLFRKEFELCNVKKGETIVLLSDLGARRDYVSAAFAATCAWTIASACAIASGSPLRYTALASIRSFWFAGVASMLS